MDVKQKKLKSDITTWIIIIYFVYDVIIFSPDITSQNLYYLLTNRHREAKTKKTWHLMWTCLQRVTSCGQTNTRTCYPHQQGAMLKETSHFSMTLHSSSFLSGSVFFLFRLSSVRVAGIQMSCLDTLFKSWTICMSLIYKHANVKLFRSTALPSIFVRQYVFDLTHI